MKTNRTNCFLGRFLSASAIVMSFFGLAQGATYYWDNDGTTAGFGAAAGTWAVPTVGSATQGWSTDATGVAATGASITTATADTINFGTATAGLTTGTIAVSGAVSAGSMTFGAASGAITLSGGTSITLAAAAAITVNNASDTISTVLAGTTLLKAGSGILNLNAANTYTGITTISAGTVKIGNATALGTIAGNTTIASGATLDLNGQTIAEPFGTIAGTGVGGNGALINSSATAASITGTITGGNFTVGGTGNITLATVTTGPVVAKIGNNTLTLGGTADNNSLAINANAGIVVLGKTSTATVHAFGSASTIGSGGTIQLGGTGDFQMWGAANLTVNSGGVLDLNGRNQNWLLYGVTGLLNLNGTGISSGGAVINNTVTTSTLTLGSGRIVLQSDSSIGGSGDIVITGVGASGAISGTSALTKVGTGRLTLGSANTYTGTTTINAGTLALSATGTLPGSAIAVKNTGSLQVATTGKTFSSLALETGSTLILPAVAAQTTTATTLTFTADPNFTVKPTFPGVVAPGTYNLLTVGSASGAAGTVTLDSSLYALPGSRAAATSSLLNTAGNLALTITTAAANLVWANGSGNGNWSLNTPADNNFKNGGLDDVFADGDHVTFGNTTSGTINLVGTLQPGSIAVTNSAGAYTFSGGGLITGITGLTKSGSSSLKLSNTGTNTYTGATAVKDGSLILAGSNDRLPISGIVLGDVATSGKLVLGDATAASNQTVAGLTTTGLGGRVVGGNAANSVLTLNNGSTNDFAGVFGGGGANENNLALTKTGAGTLIMSGSSSNTYTGLTTLNAGRIGLAKTGGAYAIPGNFTADNNLSPDLFTLENNQFAPGSVMSITNAAGDHFRFELMGTTQTLAGIDNPGLTTKGVIQHREQATTFNAISPLSTLVLNGTGSYSFNGYLRNDGGRLALTKNGTGTQTLVGANITHTGNTTIGQGRLILRDTGGGYDSALTLIASGAVLEFNASASGNTQQLNNNGQTLTGTGTLEKTGPGQLWFGGNGQVVNISLASGALIDVKEGILRNEYLAGNWSANRADLNIGSTGTFMLWDANATVDGLTGTGTIDKGQNNTHTLTIGVDNAPAPSFGGTIKNVLGVINLLKVGSGTQILSGANTYTGTTTLSGGTLALSGGLAIADTGNIVLADTVGVQLRLDSSETVGSVNGGGAVGGVIDLQANTLSLGGNNSNSSLGGAIVGTGGITKLGTGGLILSGTNTYTGPTTISLGSLVLAGTGTSNISLAAGTAANILGTTTGSLTAADTGAVLGEGTVGALTLGATAGATLHVDPATPGALSAGAVTVNGVATVSLANGSFTPGTPFTVLNFGSNANAFDGSYFALANASSYRPAVFVVDNTNKKVTLNMGSLNLSWNNSDTPNAGKWDNSSTNFYNATVPGNDFAVWGDFLAFGDAATPAGPGSGPQVISVIGAQQPAGIAVTGANDYTFNNGGAGAINGATGLTKSGTGILTLNVPCGYTGTTTVNGGSLVVGNGITLNSDTVTNNGSLTFTNSTAPASNPANTISGTGTVSYNGPAVLTSGFGDIAVSEANTYSGTTTITNTRVAASNAASFGTGAVTVANGGQIYATANGVYPNAITLNGIGWLEGAGNLGAMRLNAGATFSGPVTLASNSRITAYGGTGTISGAIGGAFNLEITGAPGTGAGGGDQLYFTGTASNTHGTTTFASNDHLVLGKTGGAVAIPGNLVMAAPGTRGIVSVSQNNQFGPTSVVTFPNSVGDTRFELKGTTQTLAGIESAGAVGVAFVQHSEFGPPAAVSGLSTLVLNVTGTNSYNFGSTTANKVYLRDQGGKVALTKTGTGTQILTGTTIIYTGTTLVDQGTLALYNNSGMVSPTTVNAGATLKLDGNTSITQAAGFTVNLNHGAALNYANVNAAGAAWDVMNGAVTNSGSTTVNISATSGANNGGLFLDGGLKGTGTVTINNTNAGMGLNLRNNNSNFVGTLIVNGIASTTVSVGSGIGVGGCTVALQGADITLNGTMEMLKGNGTGIGWANNATGAFRMGALNGPGVMVANHTSGGVTTVTMGHTNNNGAFSGIIADGTGNVVHIVKIGSGTQTLSGTNAYTGATTVADGKLLLDFATGGTNNILGLSAVALSGGTLEIKGGSGETNTQALNGISGTGGTLRLTPNGAASLNVTVGAISTASTGSINFAGGDTTVSGGVAVPGMANFITATTTTNNNGTTRLGAHMWNGTDTWASTAAAGATTYVVPWQGAYVDLYNGTNPGPVAIPTGTPGAEVRIREATGGFTNNTLGTSETINSLLMSAAGNPATLAMGTNTLTIGNGAGAAGAVGLASTAQSLTFGTVANQGVLTAGTTSAASALILNNQNPASVLTVNPSVRNNTAGGVVSLTTTGNVVLNGVNTYTGTTTITGGTLQIAGAGSLATGAYAGAITNDGTLIYSSSLDQTLSGVISGSGVVIKTGATSILSLNGANTFTGGLVISQGQVRTGNNNGAGANTGTITLGDANTGSADVSWLFNGSGLPVYPVIVSSLGTGTVTIGTHSTGTTTIPSGALTLNRAVTLQDATGDRTTFTGKISGNPGTITLTGTRITFGNGANDFTANVVVGVGTIYQNDAAGTIPDATNFTMNSNSQFRLNSNSETIGGLNGTGTVDQFVGANNTLTLGGANASGAFSGIVTNGSGALNIAKIGTGTQALIGVNAYTGTTTVTAGTLVLAPRPTFAGAVTVADGATLALASGPGAFNTTGLTFGTAGATTLNIGNFVSSAVDAPLRVSGAVVPNGTVTTNVSGVTTVGTFPLINYAGGAVGGGGVAAFTLGTLPRGMAATLVNNPTNLTIDLRVTATAGTLAWNGTVDGNWDINSTPNWLLGASAEKYIESDNVLFGNITGTKAVVLNTAVNPYAITFNNSTGNDYTISGSGSIGGTGGLTKSGTGTATLTTANTFTGATTINDGTLTIGGAGVLGGGTYAANIVDNGALAISSTAAQVLSGIISGSGSVTKASTGALTLSGVNTFAGPLTVSAGPLTVGGAGALGGGTYAPDILVNGSLVFSSTLATQTLTGAITGSGTLTKASTGDLVMGGTTSNTYAGLTTITQGRIGLSKTGGAVGIPGDVTGDNYLSPDLFTTADNQFAAGSVMRFVNSAGDHFRFELLGTTQTLGGIDNTGTSTTKGVIQQREQATAASVSLTSKLILNVTGSNSFSYNGFLRDTGGLLQLVKEGTGTQTLGGANIVYTGGTTINSGTLVFASANVGRGTMTVNNGGTLSLTVGNTTDSLGAVTINAGGTVNATANATNLTSPLTLNGGTLSGPAVGDTSYGTYVLGNNVGVGGSQTSVISADCRIGANANRTFTVAATGDASGIDLDVTGTFTHLHNVTWGYMTKDGPGVMRFSNPKTSTAVGSINQIGSVTVNAGKVVFANVIGNPGSNGGLIANAAGTIEFNPNSDQSFPNGLVGAGAFVKTGPSALTLTAAGTAMTYTGTTTVNGGKLIVPGGSTVHGNATVAATATLGMTGLGSSFITTGLNLSNGSTLDIRNFNSSATVAPVDVRTTGGLSATGTVAVKVGGNFGTPATYPLIYVPVDDTISAAVFDSLVLNKPRSVDATLENGTTSVNLVFDGITPVIWSGATNGNWDINNTENWVFKAAATKYQEADYVQFDDSATLKTIALNVPVSPTSMTFTNTAGNDYLIGGSGAITGTTGLTKTGLGKVTLATVNTYTGATTVTEGTLELGDGTANGSVVGNIANAGNVTFNNAAAQTLTSDITGVGSLTKKGAGTLALSGNKTFTGGTTVQNGTLELLAGGGANGVIGGTVTVNTGGTLKVTATDGTGYNNAATSLQTINLVGGTLMIANTAGNQTLGNATINMTGAAITGLGLAVNNLDFFQGGSTLKTFASATPSTISGVTLAPLRQGSTSFTVEDGAAAVDLDISAVIRTSPSGDGTTSVLTKAGLGTMLLSGANTYARPTTVAAGTLLLTNTTGSGTGTGAVDVVSAATLGGTGTATGSVAVASGGFLAPGMATGTVIGTLKTGALSLPAGAKFAVQYNSSGTPAADQAQVTGALTLGGDLVLADVAGTPVAIASGTKLTIATYTGALTGTFNGLAEGAMVTAGLNTFKIRYADGGNNVTLESSGGYLGWIGGFTFAPGADKTPTGDPDFDGIPNGVEFVIGGNPATGMDAALLPTIQLVNADPDGNTVFSDYLKFTYRRTKASADANVTATCQYGSTLAGWTPAANGTAGVVIIPTTGGYGTSPQVDKIEVFVPRTLGVDGKIFGRLSVVVP